MAVTKIKEGDKIELNGVQFKLTAGTLQLAGVKPNQEMTIKELHATMGEKAVGLSLVLQEDTSDYENGDVVEITEYEQDDPDSNPYRVDAKNDYEWLDNDVTVKISPIGQTLTVSDWKEAIGANNGAVDMKFQVVSSSINGMTGKTVRVFATDGSTEPFHVYDVNSNGKTAWLSLEDTIKAIKD